MAIERIVPGTAGWIMHHANHIQRYMFAADQLPIHSSVLDVACGCGYGSSYLAEHGAKRVIGADCDKDTVEIARSTYRHPAATFVQDDCHSLTNCEKYAPFDAILSLETLEHLTRPDAFLQRCRSLMSEAGLLVVSTPNVSTHAGAPYDNEFHVHEYAATELVCKLRQNGFELEVLYGQFTTDRGRLREEMREEIYRLRSNPALRLGRWLQSVLRGAKDAPPLPEKLDDFEIRKIASAEQCEALSTAGPFSLICLARKTTERQVQRESGSL